MTQADKAIAQADKAIARADKAISRAREQAERIGATPEGREAARLSSGNPALEKLTAAIFGRDV